ncbi:MAG: rRNA adenine methyltransferase [Minisyncoccota bacterium]
MDKDNEIIEFVHVGMLREHEGDALGAQESFMQAWSEASNDWEKCIAAHFVARNQANPEDGLKWNLEALDRANKAHDDRIRSYYPSLYLNIGLSYETLSDYLEAKKYYDLAFERIPDLPSDEDSAGYSEGVKKNINESIDKLKEKVSRTQNQKM